MSLKSVSFGNVIDIKYSSFDVKHGLKKLDFEEVTKIDKKRKDDFSRFQKEIGVKHVQSISHDILRIFTGDSYKEYQLLQRNLGNIAAANYARQKATVVNVTV